MIVFQGQKHRAEWKVEYLGHVSVPIWDPGVCKGRVLPLSHFAGPEEILARKWTNKREVSRALFAKGKSNAQVQRLTG